ncbi:LOW QUALITY PROTEIN: inner centromere protein [Dioscorea cayenensis subsp. rotundata]|uniref:LOW QUALITY PROTEIN: inner centromere protein n=1 Tax=Dioscorea cayennensis subsp. rotundata TaxID=55577 RepID=A0AB40CC50_DIOCR|nr:LOW QUALITY PROTEIN: inner centromere protein [Dioscorea cayenensis subsp. rotundata]
MAAALLIRLRCSSILSRPSSSISIRSLSSTHNAPPPSRRHPPPPPHDFSSSCAFLGSWEKPDDPRVAQARLDHLRKDYKRQVKQLRREYAHDVELLRVEKQRKDEARREAARLANEQRRAAKAAAAETRAAERIAFQEEFRQTLLKERAEKLELWRARELQREKKKAEQKELLLRQSSMWVAEEKSEKRILDAITAITAL